MDESEQNNIIRQGGACELLSFIIAAVGRENQESAKEEARQETGSEETRFPEEIIRNRISRRDGYQPRPGVINPSRTTSITIVTLLTAVLIINHISLPEPERRLCDTDVPRIARPAPPTEDLLTVDTGNITLLIYLKTSNKMGLLYGWADSACCRCRTH